MLDLYTAGKLKEAAETIKPVILADDQNPDALTIAGLTAYRLSSLQQAKTYFTQLSAADPTSVLAENNLAVIAYQQKQYGEEILDYNKALQIKSDNRLLLDNIAEAINSYSLDKGLSNYKALVKAFEFAEHAKETEMAKVDQLRWGSTWVTKIRWPGSRTIWPYCTTSRPSSRRRASPGSCAGHDRNAGKTGAK